MIEKADNKMMTNKDIKNKAIEEDYFFPEHGVTIKATSQEDAHKKLSIILSKDKKEEK